jgi:hypothetical protein
MIQSNKLITEQPLEPGAGAVGIFRALETTALLI